MRPPHLSPGLLLVLIRQGCHPAESGLAGRVVRARRGLAEELARTRDSAAFTRLAQMCHDGGMATQTGQTALTRIGLIMAAKGGTVADFTVGDLHG